MIYVYVDSPVTFERALRKFIKKVDKEKILQECQNRRYYIKPSERKRSKPRTYR